MSPLLTVLFGVLAFYGLSLIIKKRRGVQMRTRQFITDYLLKQDIMPIACNLSFTRKKQEAAESRDMLAIPFKGGLLLYPENYGNSFWPGTIYLFVKFSVYADVFPFKTILVIVESLRSTAFQTVIHAKAMGGSIPLNDLEKEFVIVWDKVPEMSFMGEE